jgi:hypothetical protein
MNIDTPRRINLLEEQMDVGARRKALGILSTEMEVVLLEGKVAASLTEMHFNLNGSIDDPAVSVIPGKGVADPIQDQAKGVGSVIKGAADLLGREETKWIRKPLGVK